MVAGVYSAGDWEPLEAPEQGRDVTSVAAQSLQLQEEQEMKQTRRGEEVTAILQAGVAGSLGQAMAVSSGSRVAEGRLALFPLSSTC